MKWFKKQTYHNINTNADIMSNQFDRISIQQSNIEEQQNIIKIRGKNIQLKIIY
jgi:hypothetical protein